MMLVAILISLVAAACILMMYNRSVGVPLRRE